MRRRAARLLTAALLLVAIGIAFSQRDALDIDALSAWVDAAGVAGPLLFVAIYLLATVLFLPGSVLTLAAGALFGPLFGSLYALGGATLGAGAAFLIARHLAGDWVEARSGGLLRQLKQGVEREGWRFVAFVRLVPLFPFNLLNYALGLTRIRFSHYLIASLLCMAPASFAYTYLGFAGREALAGGEGVVRKVLLAVALVATVAFVSRLVSRRRAVAGWSPLPVTELQQRLGNEGGLPVVDVRSRAEFDGELGHLAGAINVPLDELADRIDELERYRDTPLALICHTDRRSATAAGELATRGFAAPLVVEGGMVAWRQAGLPVENGG